MEPLVKAILNKNYVEAEKLVADALSTKAAELIYNEKRNLDSQTYEESFEKLISEVEQPISPADKKFRELHYAEPRDNYETHPNEPEPVNRNPYHGYNKGQDEDVYKDVNDGDNDDLDDLDLDLDDIDDYEDENEEDYNDIIDSYRDKRKYKPHFEEEN